MTTVPRSHYSAGADTVAFVRQTWAGLRVLLVLTVVLGLAYPLAVTGVSQLLMRWQANGSLVSATGERVTSRELQNRLQTSPEARAENQSGAQSETHPASLAADDGFHTEVGDSRSGQDPAE